MSELLDLIDTYCDEFRSSCDEGTVELADFGPDNFAAWLSACGWPHYGLSQAEFAAAVRDAGYDPGNILADD